MGKEIDGEYYSFWGDEPPTSDLESSKKSVKAKKKTGVKPPVSDAAGSFGTLKVSNDDV